MPFIQWLNNFQYALPWAAVFDAQQVEQRALPTCDQQAYVAPITPPFEWFGGDDTQVEHRAFAVCDQQAYVAPAAPHFEWFGVFDAQVDHRALPTYDQQAYVTPATPPVEWFAAYASYPDILRYEPSSPLGFVTPFIPEPEPPPPPPPKPQTVYPSGGGWVPEDEYYEVVDRRLEVDVVATSLQVDVYVTVLPVEVVERGNIVFFTARFNIEPDEVHFIYTKPGEERPITDSGFGNRGSKIVRLSPKTYLFSIDTTGFRGGTLDWHFFSDGMHKESAFGSIRIPERKPQLL